MLEYDKLLLPLVYREALNDTLHRLLMRLLAQARTFYIQDPGYC